MKEDTVVDKGVAKSEQQMAEDVKPQETVVEFLSSIAGLVATVLFIMTFVFQTFAIPSSSMEDTLLIGDHVLVDRERFAPQTSWLGPVVPYRNVRRGDTAVFLSPEQPGLFLVKRIIGIPGDRIHLREGVVYRNGEKLDEPYVKHVQAGYYDPYRDEFPAMPPSLDSRVTSEMWREEMATHVAGGEIVVPPNSYFAMGDNRDVSKDSRYWGFVPQANLIGRPLVIYWSFITPPDEYENQGLGDRLQAFVHTIIHFFDETRWSRTLRIVR
jgi:signal peptidase I